MDDLEFRLLGKPVRVQINLVLWPAHSAPVVMSRSKQVQVPEYTKGDCSVAEGLPIKSRPQKRKTNLARSYSL